MTNHYQGSCVLACFVKDKIFLQYDYYNLIQFPVEGILKNFWTVIVGEMKWSTGVSFGNT